MKKFALLLLALCAALVPIGTLAAPGWAYTITKDMKADKINEAISNATGEVTFEPASYDLDATITIGKTVTLKGNGARLNGQNQCRVFEITNGEPTIDGFVIANGGADSGGGIYKTSGTLTVTNCRFEGNTADMGGGIYSQTTGSLTVKRCTFYNNTGGNGGGIHIEKNTDADVDTIENCTFTENKTQSNNSNGGGLYVCYGGPVTVNYCTFVNNKATMGAEIYCDDGNGYDQTSRKIENSIIYGSTAGVDTSTCLTNNELKLTSVPTSTSDEKTTVGGVTHTVFRKHDQLIKAVRTGAVDLPEDQLGAIDNTHDIGAVEIAAAPVTLTGVSVDITGNTPLTVTQGQTGTLTLGATVTATYSDGKTEPLTSGYNLAWKATGTLPAGFSFTDGTLTVGTEAAATGSAVLVPVEVQASTTDGSVTSQAATANVSVTVTASANPDGPTPTPTPTPDPTPTPTPDPTPTPTPTPDPAKPDSEDVTSDDATARPKITTKTLPDATLDKAYSASLSATGDEPIRWKIVSGSLPAGLKLNKNTGKISGKPTERGTVTFTAQASNAAGTDERPFSIRVPDISPARLHTSWKVTYSPKSTSKNTIKVNIRFMEKKGTNVKYTIGKITTSTKTNLSVKTVNKAEAGAGYVRVKYKRKGGYRPKGTIKFDGVTAENNSGKSVLGWEVKFPEEGKINGKKSYFHFYDPEESSVPAGYALLSAGDGDELDDDPDDEFDDGGDEDEDGGITAVIGSASGEYVYPSLDGLLSALAGQLDKVVILEFRGAAGLGSLKTADLAKLTNLSDIEISECPDLTEVDLSGNAALATLSVFSCPALSSLNVRNCAELVSLEALECANLKKLVIDGCSELQCLSLNGASSLETLDLDGAAGGSVALAAGFSRFSKLSLLTVNDCGKLSTLKVAGCPALEDLDAAYTNITKLDLSKNTALTDVFLNKTKVDDLDLSQCPKLKSLSLVGAEDLTDLKLNPDAKLEEFDLDGSQVTSLNFRGNTEITELDLSGNTRLTSLDLSGCSSLKTLNLTGDTALTSLDLTGCLALETLEANGCESLAALDVNDCQALQTASLEGLALTGLDLSLYEALVSLDLAGCGDLVSLDVRRCALRELKVDGCAKLASLNCAENALGQLELTGLESLTAASADCDGQVIGGVSMDVTLNLSPWAGEELTRVSAVKGCDADGAPIETGWKAETGVATFASVPAKVTYLYDTGLDDRQMDVTLTAAPRTTTPRTTAPPATRAAAGVMPAWGAWRSLPLRGW